MPLTHQDVMNWTCDGKMIEVHNKKELESLYLKNNRAQDFETFKVFYYPWRAFLYFVLFVNIYEY